MVQGTLFALMVTLRQLGVEFQTELKIIKEGEESQIYKEIELYRQLKGTTDFAGKMYGDCMLAFYLSFVTYWFEAPHILLGRRGEAEIALLIFSSVTTIIWVLAAEFHYRVQHAIVEWTTFYLESESLSLEDRLKMFSIRWEVSTQPVAFSCRCFSATYKHLSSMLGLVVTYMIIVVQLNRD
ncbi:unnamed protein product [Orchesella dallaii]|uniref:Uncharacterized protein n=1 Tax=Orchesella dallaii TaxID=48710 RepID=A0ABP1QGX3_9HEXA